MRRLFAKVNARSVFEPNSAPMKRRPEYFHHIPAPSRRTSVYLILPIRLHCRFYEIVASNRQPHSHNVPMYKRPMTPDALHNAYQLMVIMC